MSAGKRILVIAFILVAVFALSIANMGCGEKKAQPTAPPTPPAAAGSSSGPAPAPTATSGGLVQKERHRERVKSRNQQPQ